MQPNKEEVKLSLETENEDPSIKQQNQTNDDIQQNQQQNLQQPPNDKSFTIQKSDSNKQDEPQTSQTSIEAIQSIIQPIIPTIPVPPPKNKKKSTKQNQQTTTQNQSQGLQMPVFWNLLNEADKESYNKMRTALSSPACKHRRHHSNELNREIVNTIKNFVVRNDPDDWKRALVTGIVWLPNAIAINTRQLRLLLSKCKSSINALFQNLGYYTIPTTNDYSSSIIACFPLLKDNFTELRKWTIRLVSPPDAKSTIHQQQQAVFQQQQTAQPLQVIQLQQQVKVETPEEKKNEATSLSNENDIVADAQQQIQGQNIDLNTIHMTKIPVTIQEQNVDH